MRVTRIIVTLVFVITLAGFYSLYNYLKVGLEAQTLQATEESMVEQAHLLSALLENNLSEDSILAEELSDGFKKAHQHSFDAKIYQMAKTKVGIHFYITDAEGIVLHDSGNPERQGKDFSNKLDIYNTLNGRYGARSSRTVENDDSTSVMYVAAPIKNDQGELVGVITLYKGQADVRAFIEDRRRWIIYSLILIGVGISCFTVAVFIWLFRPLGKLTQYARLISKGGRPPYPKLGKGREVNTLGQALQHMRESLEGRDYLENYVQMLTHELKSPLSAIRGAAELMDEDMPAEQRSKFLQNIQLETTRSQRIIDGLLKLSKLESLHQLQTNEHLELAPILEEAQSDESSLAQQKNITVKLDCSPDHTIHGDRMSIIAAVSNMLINAIEFSPENGTILLTSREVDKHIEIQVKDEGVGVPDYALDRVFENFYSIARPGSSKKSSGLGLAFVREVAQLHHGYATLKNRDSQGVTATLAIQK